MQKNKCIVVFLVISFISVSCYKEQSKDITKPFPESLTRISQEDIDFKQLKNVKEFSKIIKAISKDRLVTIKQINLTKCDELTTLQGINELVNLRTISVFNSKKLTSIRDIEKNVNLEYVNFYGCSSLKNVDSLRNLQNLRVVGLYDTAVEELPDLTNTLLSESGQLVISKTLIKDLTKLHLPQGIAEIRYQNMNVSSLEQVKELFNYPFALILDDNNINEIPDEFNFHNVKRLSLANNPIAKTYIHEGVSFIKKGGVTINFTIDEGEQ